MKWSLYFITLHLKCLNQNVELSYRRRYIFSYGTKSSKYAWRKGLLIINLYYFLVVLAFTLNKRRLSFRNPWWWLEFVDLCIGILETFNCPSFRDLMNNYTLSQRVCHDRSTAILPWNPNEGTLCTGKLSGHLGLTGQSKCEIIPLRNLTAVSLTCSNLRGSKYLLECIFRYNSTGSGSYFLKPLYILFYNYALN